MRPKNPFNPTAPIDPEYFAGRHHEIEIILRALNQTRHGSQQNVLVTGERGIGKSSLALLARYIAQEPRGDWQTDCKFATGYYTLDDKDTVGDCCQGAIEQLNRTIRPSLTDRFFEKIRQLDCSIKLNFWFGSTEIEPRGKVRSDTDAAKIRKDFVKILEALWDELKGSGYNGILIVLDELNKIKTKENLGAFFKKVSESLVSDGYRKTMILAVGLPWLEQKIAEDDLSAVRVFEHVALDPMRPSESQEVVDKALAGTGVSISDDARARLVDWAGGYPYFLQQMCFDSFEADTDQLIDVADVNSGVSRSLTQFDRMFFGRVLREVEGKNYQKIIEALAPEDSGMPVGVLQRESGVKGVGQYLPKLLKDGVITSPKKVSTNWHPRRLLYTSSWSSAWASSAKKRAWTPTLAPRRLGRPYFPPNAFNGASHPTGPG